MRTLTFTAIGVAQTQGSTRAFIPKGWKRPIITTDNPKNKGNYILDSLDRLR